MKKVLLTSRNFDVCEDEFRYNNAGEVRTIQYVEQWPVVIAVVETRPGKLLMVEHWRPILGTSLIECPGGKADQPGESLEEAIVREVAEETGLQPESLERLCSIFSSVGASTEEVTCFAARNNRVVPRDVRDVKRMELREMAAEDVHALLLAGEIRDGKSSVALFQYFHRHPVVS